MRETEKKKKICLKPFQLLNQSFLYNFLQKIFLLLLTFETRPIAISCVLQAINKQPMDRPTNKAVYRVVCMQLKKIIFKVWRTIFYHIPHFGKQKTTQKTCYQPMDLQHYGWTDGLMDGQTDTLVQESFIFCIICTYCD